MNPQPPGGELDMIGIEQLIQIDDLQNNKQAVEIQLNQLFLEIRQYEKMMIKQQHKPNGMDPKSKSEANHEKNDTFTPFKAVEKQK